MEFKTSAVKVFIYVGFLIVKVEVEMGRSIPIEKIT